MQPTKHRTEITYESKLDPDASVDRREAIDSVREMAHGAASRLFCHAGPFPGARIHVTVAVEYE